MVHYKSPLGKKGWDAIQEMVLSEPVNVKKRKRAGIIAIVTAILLFFIAVMNFMQESTGAGIRFCVAGVLFLVFALCGKKYQKFIIRFSQRKIDPAILNSDREYFFDENGVKVQSVVEESMNSWDKFQSWGTCKNYIYLKRKDKKMMLVDQDKLSADELSELKRLLQNRVQP